jgi:4-hydroxybenzoate polyprenyltransferase
MLTGYGRVADGAILSLLVAGERVAALTIAARPKHWVKNAACLAGVVFSGRLTDIHSVAMAGWAVAGFCLASSGVYLVNDVLDRESDRRNPKKRTRPIASGALPASWAIVGASLMLVAALTSAIPLGPYCGATLAAYTGLNLCYSYRLKHRVLVDVLIIASGFVLRVLYGVYAIGVKPSSWIVLCMFFLALFLGFSKRRSELDQFGEGGHLRRPVLRGYDLKFLEMSLAMTATMAIVCYALYTVTGRQGNASLVITVPIVTYGILRHLLRIIARGVGDEPVSAIFADKVSFAIIIAWVSVCAVVVHSGVRLFEV